MKTILTAESDSFGTSLKKIWSYRALISAFAIRDLKVKYAQTRLGLAWSFLQPLVGVFIYTFFFEFMLNISINELPFSVYVLSGLMGWNFFTNAFTQGSSSLQESSGLIRKVYFPKSVLPLSKVLVATLELVFSAVILVPLMMYYQVPLSANILMFPFIWLYNAICALALVYWLNVLSTKTRDLNHLMPVIVYFGIWFTPVFFSVDNLPENFRWLLDYNPMANVVHLWRWMLFSYGELRLVYLLNASVMVVVCGLGMYFYSRLESRFSDYI